MRLKWPGTISFWESYSAFRQHGLVGVCVYKICYEQFFNAPRNISMLCTIGFSMVVKNLAQIVFGPNQKPMLNIVDNKIYKLGVVQISTVQIVVVITVVVSATVLSFFFNKTRWGIRLRAVSQDKTAAYMVGVNVKRTAMVGNCVAARWRAFPACCFPFIIKRCRQPWAGRWA